jgi:hypothetical protein
MLHTSLCLSLIGPPWSVVLGWEHRREGHQRKNCSWWENMVQPSWYMILGSKLIPDSFHGLILRQPRKNQVVYIWFSVIPIKNLILSGSRYTHNMLCKLKMSGHTWTRGCPQCGRVMPWWTRKRGTDHMGSRIGRRRMLNQSSLVPAMIYTALELPLTYSSWSDQLIFRHDLTSPVEAPNSIFTVVHAIGTQRTMNRAFLFFFLLYHSSRAGFRACGSGSFRVMGHRPDVPFSFLFSFLFFLITQVFYLFISF